MIFLPWGTEATDVIFLPWGTEVTDAIFLLWGTEVTDVNFLPWVTDLEKRKVPVQGEINDTFGFWLLNV